MSPCLAAVCLPRQTICRSCSTRSASISACCCCRRAGGDGCAFTPSTQGPQRHRANVAPSCQLSGAISARTDLLTHLQNSRAAPQFGRSWAGIANRVRRSQRQPQQYTVAHRQLESGKKCSFQATDSRVERKYATVCRAFRELSGDGGDRGG